MSTENLAELKNHSDDDISYVDKEILNIDQDPENFIFKQTLFVTPSSIDDDGTIIENYRNIGINSIPIGPNLQKYNKVPQKEYINFIVSEHDNKKYNENLNMVLTGDGKSNDKKLNINYIEHEILTDLLYKEYKQLFNEKTLKDYTADILNKDPIIFTLYEYDKLISHDEKSKHEQKQENNYIASITYNNDINKFKVNEIYVISDNDTSNDFYSINYTETPLNIDEKKKLEKKPIILVSTDDIFLKLSDLNAKFDELPTNINNRYIKNFKFKSDEHKFIAGKWSRQLFIKSKKQHDFITLNKHPDIILYKYLDTYTLKPFENIQYNIFKIYIILTILAILLDDFIEFDVEEFTFLKSTPNYLVQWVMFTISLMLTLDSILVYIKRNFAESVYDIIEAYNKMFINKCNGDNWSNNSNKKIPSIKELANTTTPIFAKLSDKNDSSPNLYNHSHNKPIISNNELNEEFVKELNVRDIYNNNPLYKLIGFSYEMSIKWLQASSYREHKLRYILVIPCNLIVFFIITVQTLGLFAIILGHYIIECILIVMYEISLYLYKNRYIFNKYKIINDIMQNNYLTERAIYKPNL